jgi:hypothetical protein
VTTGRGRVADAKSAALPSVSQPVAKKWEPPPQTVEAKARRVLDPKKFPAMVYKHKITKDDKGKLVSDELEHLTVNDPVDKAKALAEGWKESP